MEIGKVPLCHSLNSCVFSVLHPNVQSCNFLRACLERMNFITYEQEKIHVFQTGPKYFQSIGFKMLGYYIPIYVFPIPAFLESCVSKRF